MLHEEDGRAALQQQLLDLAPGENVDVVQRLVPEVELGRLAEAPGQEDLLPLPHAEALHGLLELAPGEVQLPQEGQEQGPVQTVSLRVVRQGSGKAPRVLLQIGDHQAAGQPHGPRGRGGLPGQQAQEAGLSGPVGARQVQPVPPADREAHRGEDRPLAVVHGHVPELRQHLAAAGQAGQAEAVGLLDVLQQAALLLHGRLLPPGDGLGPLIGLAGLLPQVGLCQPGANLLPLGPVGPAGLLPGGLLQPGDLLLQSGVLRQLRFVLPPPVFQPGGAAALPDLDGGPVDGQDVVHAAVQKGLVVGDQDEALLAVQIAAQQLPPPAVQVVGGLVDEQEAVLPQKEGGQEELGPLPVGEGGVGPPEDPLIQLQLGQLPQQPPAGQPRTAAGGDLLSALAPVLHREGEVVEGHRGADGAPVFVLAHQQPQEGGLPPAVPAHEAQPPVGVQLKARVLKQQLRAAVISKSQVLNGDQCHGRFLQSMKMAAGFPRGHTSCISGGRHAELPCSRRTKTGRPQPPRAVSSKQETQRILSLRSFVYFTIDSPRFQAPRNIFYLFSSP